eukprot:3346448-Pyramimonas_sp.AAC.1
MPQKRGQVQRAPVHCMPYHSAALDSRHSGVGGHHATSKARCCKGVVSDGARLARRSSGDCQGLGDGGQSYE